MRAFILSLIVALAVSACSSEPEPVVKWSKPGASYDAFLTVRAQCLHAVESRDGSFFIAGERYPGAPTLLGGIVDEIGSPFGMHDTRSDVGPDPQLFSHCMNANGYTRDVKGYAAPADERVPMEF